MGFWSKKPSKTDDEPYDPSRLYDVHERGITLNLEQFRKKPGIQEDHVAMQAIGQSILKKQATQRHQGDSR